MGATIGNIYRVRLNSFKSFRHYGGREITTFIHFVDAELVGLQDSFNPYIVVLKNDVLRDGKLQFEKGRKIAIMPKDFNVHEKTN